MDKIKVIEILRLFNEKTDDLRRSRYLKSIIENDTGFSLVIDNKGSTTVTVKGPDDDAIKAFVLTFRFFIQDNERCSIRNIAKIYEDLDIPEEIKEDFRINRKGINVFLNNYSSLKLNSEIVLLSKILDIFFYGGLAHANEEKKRLYDKWMSNIVVKGIFVSEFHAILGTMFRFILFVEELNEKVLELLLKESV